MMMSNTVALHQVVTWTVNKISTQTADFVLYVQQNSIVTAM